MFPKSLKNFFKKKRKNFKKSKIIFLKMNEIFHEVIEKKKFHIDELQKQLQNGSKSIVDNRLILESVSFFLLGENHLRIID